MNTLMCSFGEQMLRGHVPAGLVKAAKIQIEPGNLIWAISQDNRLEGQAAGIEHGKALNTLFSFSFVAEAARAQCACRILNFIEHRVPILTVDSHSPGEAAKTREVPAYTPFLTKMLNGLEHISLEMLLGEYLKAGYFQLEMPQLVTSWDPEHDAPTPARALLELAIERRQLRMIDALLDLGATLENIPFKDRGVKGWALKEVKAGDAIDFIESHFTGGWNGETRARLIGLVLARRMQKEISSSHAAPVSADSAPCSPLTKGRRRSL